MSSNSISTSHSPQARELRSGTGSSISSEPRIHVQKKNISASKSRSNMISNTVVSPKVIRRISKKSTGRKIRSNSKTTEGNLTSQAKNTGEIFEADNTIEADRTQTSNINDYSDISNLVIDETIVNLYDDEMELLNKSDDTAEDLKQKRTTRMKKEDVMKYFTRQEDGSLKCNLCPNSANKVFSKSNEHSDTNIRNHLGKVHSKAEFLYPSQKSNYQPKARSINIEEKKIIDQAAIDAIVKDSLPFNHFQKTGMKNFLSIIKPGYQGVNRKTVRKRLELLYRQRRKAIKDELASMASISLTADVWKSPSRHHFICLTCHYLDSTYQNKSFVLSFRRFPEKHSGENIRTFIRSEIQKMNLQGKIQSITTDNGSDIKSATNGASELGTRISCGAHNLNLVIKNALWLFEKKRSNRNLSTTVNHRTTNTDEDEAFSDDDDYASDTDLTDNDFDNDSSEVEEASDESDAITSSTDDEALDNFDTNGEEQVPSLTREYYPQISSNVTTSGSTSNLEALPSIILNLLKHVRKLVTFIRKSSVLDRYVKCQIKSKKSQINQRTEEQLIRSTKPKEVVLDFSIRWNTTFVMVSRLISMNSIITDITTSPNESIGLKQNQYDRLRSLSFSRFDWLCLVALKNILSPFYHATKLLSGSNYPTLSLAYSVLLALKNFLLTAKDDQPIENALKKLLLVQFKYYFEENISFEQKRATLIAAFLDPCVYIYLSDQDIGEIERWLVTDFEVYQSLDQLQINNRTTSSETIRSQSLQTRPISADGTSRMKSCINHFFQICEMTTISNSKTIAQKFTFKEEIGHYLSTARESTSFTRYWCENEHKLPNLARFVKRYNCIPVTSVPSESAFSVAGHIQRKSRASLSSTALRYTMILRE